MNCQNLQELFRYSHNSHWKWNILAQLPAQSDKSCQILTNQNCSGSFSKNSPISSPKSSHGFIAFSKMQNFNHGNLFPFLNCHIQHFFTTQQIFVPFEIATDFWFFTALTKFIIMINCLYCENPQELFYIIIHIILNENETHR